MQLHQIKQDNVKYPNNAKLKDKKGKTNTITDQKKMQRFDWAVQRLLRTVCHQLTKTS